jgi:hypothetical protein
MSGFPKYSRTHLIARGGLRIAWKIELGEGQTPDILSVPTILSQWQAKRVIGIQLVVACQHLPHKFCENIYHPILGKELMIEDCGDRIQR